MSGEVDTPARGVGGRTVIGAGWLVAWRLVTRGLGLVSTLVLARLLVPADFGLVAMATAFSGSVAALSELGVGDALVRRAGNERGHYDTAFTMQAIRGLLTGAALAASGLGWQPVAMAPVPALLTGGAIGLAALLLFAITQLTLWRLAGQPSGPEQRLLTLVAELLPDYTPLWIRKGQFFRP